jgi:hypothetical protein
MEKKLFDISAIDVKEPQETIDARTARQSAYYARQVEAIELIEALKWCDLNRANQWIASHKERLTDAYALSEIIEMAMAYGVYDEEQKRSDARHKQNREKDALVLKRWKELEAEGYSKNKAAEAMSKEIELEKETIRGKLQGK